MDEYVVSCTLGWREYVEKFRDASNAQLFVKKMLGKDKLKWKSPTRIVAKAAETLWIDCPQLEEVMEASGKGRLRDGVEKKVQAFLYGVWKNGDAKIKPVESIGLKGAKKQAIEDHKSMMDGGGGAWRKSASHVSLAELCKQQGWDDRRARRVLRKAGIKNEGRWQFSAADVAAVKDVLSKVM